MQDSFDGSNYILIQPGDSGLPFRFKFPACTASSKNDGSLPYGSTVKGCTSARLRPIAKVATTAFTTAPIQTVTRSSNKIILTMGWTTTVTKGQQYRLTMKLKISNSDGSTSHRQFDFNRVFFKEL